MWAAELLEAIVRGNSDSKSSTVRFVLDDRDVDLRIRRGELDDRPLDGTALYRGRSGRIWWHGGLGGSTQSVGGGGRRRRPIRGRLAWPEVLHAAPSMRKAMPPSVCAVSSTGTRATLWLRYLNDTPNPHAVLGLRGRPLGVA